MTKQAELLLQNTAIALKKLKVKAEFEKVSEFQKVVAYGVMVFPALVIDEKLVAEHAFVRLSHYSYKATLLNISFHHTPLLKIHRTVRNVRCIFLL